MKNKKVVWIIIGIVSVALIALAITYAYWQITASQQGVNEISSACLDISLVDAESGNAGITLQDQYPLSDTEGEALTPYKFTVTNNCDVALDYHINLEILGESTSALKASSIKVMLDEKTKRILYNYENVTPTLAEAYESFLIGRGTLAKSGDDGSSVTHELRLWIDEDAPVSEVNKTFNSKVTVSVGQKIQNQGSSLATLIMNDAEESGYLNTSTPNFGSATNDGEYGLYKAEDDYGDSYYFRGDVENNYVELGNIVDPDLNLTSDNLLEIWTAITDDEYMAAFVFKSKSACESAIGEECESSYVEKVYYSNTGDEEAIDGLLGFTTNELCADAAAAVDECIEKTAEELKTRNMYWRIIRINGDGTIKLIYDGTELVENGTYHNNFVAPASFNSKNDSEEYVGYVYGEANTSSTIKETAETWYTNYLEENYGKYIADSIFCNDREKIITETDIYDNQVIYYEAYDRLITNRSPKLTCTRNEDKLTVANGKLTKPIGLITADEAVMAGVNYSSSSYQTHYLHGGVYFTMTPFAFKDNEAINFKIGRSSSADICHGQLCANQVINGESVRPVINIKAEVLFEGEGTILSPYKLAN